MSSSDSKMKLLDLALAALVFVLAYCVFKCCQDQGKTSTPEPYAPLAYFTVKDPKYQVDSQNVMSAPIVYSGPEVDPASGQSVRPVPINGMMQAGPVSPVMDDKESYGKREGFQYPMPENVKTIVPAHLSGGFVNPLSNPQMGFLPGGMEYGVSVPAIGNLSSSVTSNSSPGSLNVWSSVL
jgi:hypothetical protein